MNQTQNKWLRMSLIILFCFIVSGLISCSQEAKKECHWKRGEKYYSENKFKEAIIEYKNVIQIDPQNANAHYKLGLALLRTG
jgi:tetratricopeptide (TPR) repeat protein